MGEKRASRKKRGKSTTRFTFVMCVLALKTISLDNLYYMIY